MRVIYSDWGLANYYKDYIEINRDLKYNKKLRDYVIKHELGHKQGFDLLHEFDFKKELFLLSKRWHITPEQIYFIDGIVKKSRSGIFLSTMTNVEVRQSGFERFLNVGKIELHGFQKDGPIIIPGVRNPEYVAN